MTTHKEFYYILTFNTTTNAMCADKCAKENTNDIRAALMPLPQEFKSGCGFALRFLDDNLDLSIYLYKTHISLVGLHFSYVIFNCHAYSKIIQKFSWNRLKTSFSGCYCLYFSV